MRQKLVVTIGSNSYTIEDKYISIQLSEKTTKSTAGIFALEPQRLTFRFYLADFVEDFQNDANKTAEYYEDEQLIFKGFTKYSAKNDGLIGELVFYDYLLQLDYHANDTITISPENNERYLTKTLNEWFNYIVQQAGVSLNAQIDPNIPSAQGNLYLAEYSTFEPWSPSADYTVDMTSVFNELSAPSGVVTKIYEIYLKYNQINNKTYMIAIYRLYGLYDTGQVDDDGNAIIEEYSNWRMKIWEIINLTGIIEIVNYYSNYFYGEIYWQQFINNQGDYGQYHDGWVNSLNIGQGYFKSSLIYVPGDGGSYEYHTFPVQLHLAEIEWPGFATIEMYYSGSIVLNKITYIFEEDNNGELIDKEIDFHSIFMELLKLSDAVAFAGTDGIIKVRNRLTMEGISAYIALADTEEYPKSDFPALNSSVSIGNTFLPEGHPVIEKLEEHYENLEDNIEKEIIYNYYGNEPIDIHRKLIVNGIDNNLYIVKIQPVINESENYKRITVWKRKET